MLTRIGLVRRPAIMHDGPSKVDYDPDGIQGLSSSFEMRRIMGQLFSGRHMRPAVIGAHAHHCFILMQQWLLMQAGFELLFDGSQGLMVLLDKASDAACRELDSEEIVQDLAGTHREPLALQPGTRPGPPDPDHIEPRL